jgi:signal transduction histidine kinase
VRIWLQDNGIGIAPEHQEIIFGLFERLHNVATYPSTGVGLAIVRKAMERMGGRVGLTSKPGEGSRFWLDLPNTAPPEPAHTPRPSEAVAADY